MTGTALRAERRWTHDRTGWDGGNTRWGEPGPWHDEPDKAQWVDAATGYAALAVRNHLGAWCGYVGLPPGHPLHGVDYSDGRCSDVNVHGGLTFADGCMESAPEGEGICHVPEPGQEDNVWWLGFDCAHAGDLVPRMPVFAMARFGGTYRTLDYVQEECQRLATQLDESDEVLRLDEDDAQARRPS